ncbi:hypothetical protein N3K66_001736 [Trichothecium roseum]|uniref:Uncharacterized protein n=1 Tax=Trichothecium roseum TaxID=47278 RepID=A0ACC0V850_9HYPO|nr:hypothetical protein N3K66_001736 [Trichothecium roseum]
MENAPADEPDALASQVLLCPIDPWPTVRVNKPSNDDEAPEYEDWDGLNLCQPTIDGTHHFEGYWSLESFMAEVEVALLAKIVDIPLTTYGANHFGLFIQLEDHRAKVLARLSRSDLNNPKCHPCAMKQQIKHDHFELATYRVLVTLGSPFNCEPLYHRDPIRKSRSLSFTHSPDISGRRLFIFAKAEGEHLHYGRWRALEDEQKDCLLIRSARLSAMQFRLTLPQHYVDAWLWERIFNTSRLPDGVKVEPTRDFCVALLKAEVEVTVGATAAAASTARNLELRDALIKLIPSVVPQPKDAEENDVLYRFALDHGDFGVHNMTVTADPAGLPRVTSVFDWEGGSIVPAILTEPKMVVTVDLTIGRCGRPSIGRWGDGDTPDKMDEYEHWSEVYYSALFQKAPELRVVIARGLYARYMWFMMRKIRNETNQNTVAEDLEQLTRWVEKTTKAVDDDQFGHASAELLRRPLELCHRGGGNMHCHCSP